MNLSKFAILLLFVANSQTILFAQAQKYIGANLGYNKSASIYSTFSLGLRKDRQLNNRNTLGFDLLWYMPTMRSDRMKLDGQDPIIPDTVVQTTVREEAFRFQINHRHYIVSGADKSSVYFSYGLGFDVFHIWERLPHYDTYKYDRPLLIPMTAYSYEELDFGLSGHAALGYLKTLKGNHSVYMELACAYSIGSMTMAFFSLDRLSIPNYVSLKTGYRFAYSRRKKS